MTSKGFAAMAAIAHNVTPEDIFGYNRTPHIVRARWHAWALAREAGWSLNRIGRAFNRDHTTILHGLREMQ